MTGPEHIFSRHAFNSGYANVSRFAEGTSLRQVKDFVDVTLRYGKVSSDGAGYIRDFGYVIGTDRAGNPVTALQVWVRDGIIQTAYPVAAP